LPIQDKAKMNRYLSGGNTQFENSLPRSFFAGLSL